MERIDKVKSIFESRPEKLSRDEVPSAVIRRLPRYHRYLGELLRQNRMRISSSELASMMCVTASQIRQDLNRFGGFGQQGYGYNVRLLHAKIGEILGISEGFSAVVVGAGNLGRALVSSQMFERRGVARLALFDVNPAIIGTSVAGLTVLPYSSLADYCREHSVSIAVLTTPKEASDEVVSVLLSAGVRGIWNFTNKELRVDDPLVTVENTHLGDALMALCYEMAKKRTEGEDTE